MRSLVTIHPGSEMSSSHRDDSIFRDIVAMAPMATGGNLPYRRLCREYGADITCSEMTLAHKLVKGSRAELPLLRHHPDELVFGIQIAGKDPGVMADAARMVVDHGADYVDLNFGCPIDVVVRRGSGAAMLKRPGRLGRVVAAVVEAVAVPVLVKLRIGWSAEKINVMTTAREAVDGGAAVLSIHGRTREQRYRRAADWGVIGEVAAAVDVPVLGNGDILTVWDHELRLRETGVSGVVAARGALIKPWIFKELKEGRPWYPTPAERWGMMRRFHEMATEHFGDDEKGQGRVERFFLWHLGFWNRYRPWTEAEFLDCRPSSLIQQRSEDPPAGTEEALLASSDPEDHARIWQRLLDGDHPAD